MEYYTPLPNIDDNGLALFNVPIFAPLTEIVLNKKNQN